MDILTYVAIRSFRNPDNYNCYPAYETIAMRMGASKSFVMDSVKRLVKSGHICIHKIAYLSNQYYFTPFDITDRIPPEILDLDLSIYEKAILLVLRQFCAGVPHQTLSSIKDIASEIGLSYKTVYKQITSLIEKGYVIERRMKFTYKKNGFDISPKIDWWFEYDKGTKNNDIKEEEFRLVLV